jgi:signal transduction histidine kinase
MLDRVGAAIKRQRPFLAAASHDLGLATARAAVEAHGGSVTVEGHPGGGAAFRMLFPPNAGLNLVRSSGRRH